MSKKREIETMVRIMKNRIDGPGSWNREGWFLDCFGCERRVWVNRQGPFVCPNCGREFPALAKRKT